MPYARPSFSQLRALVAADIAANLPSSDALLRHANLTIMGKAQAGLAHGQYGYLDYIAQQATPYTATDEYLEAWAALVKIYRKPATSASGAVTFVAADGKVIPAGTLLARPDGVEATTIADVTASGGFVIVSATINPDTTGQTGAFGNTDVGTSMSLATAIAGIQSTGTVSTAFAGGADIEQDDKLRSRMLLRYQRKPQGGAVADYIEWALEVSGVTRAWCDPCGFGIGTSVVYTMWDDAESAHGGFPQGSNGVASSEKRGIAATGDLLTVANHIYPLRPVTALVYSCAPTGKPIDFTIKGIPSAFRAAALLAIQALFLDIGDPTGSIVPLAYIWTAVSNVTGVDDFIIVSPAGSDITIAVGKLPTLGTVTWVA